MTRDSFKELMGLVHKINNRIATESKCYDILLEDHMGVPRGLAATSDELVNAIGNATGNTELCYWFIYDNDFGACSLEYDGIEISTLDDLYDIITKGGS